MRRLVARKPVRRYTVTPPVVDQAIKWGARVDDTLYENAPYLLGAADMPPWSFGQATPTPYSLFVSHANGNVPSIIHFGGPGAAAPSSFETTPFGQCRSYGAIALYSMSFSQAELADLLANTNTTNVFTKLDAWFNGAKTLGHPLFLRPMWEMNGNWNQGWAYQVTPGQGVTGISAANYIIIWRRIWQRCADIMGGFSAGSGSGVSTGNVSFVWCPNVYHTGDGNITNPTGHWPGDTYIDVPALDGYLLNGSPLEDAATVFGQSLTILRGLSSKKIMICETGVQAVTGKAARTTDFLSTFLPANPDIGAVVWFNQIDGVKQWPIEIGDAAGTYGGAAQTAFATAISSSYFQDGGTGYVNATNFPNGTKPQL